MSIWYAHSSSRNIDRPTIQHLYRSEAGRLWARPVCGASGFYRMWRPARKNSALPKCSRCHAADSR